MAPSELQLVANAVPERRAEFIGGRWCAHRALEKLGLAAETIMPGQFGAPTWPARASGSITHESGLCAAAVAPRACLRHIGIDCLNTHRDTDLTQLTHLFSTAADQFPTSLRTASERALVCFCAKEAVVKAISLCASRYLDLREIRVLVDSNSFLANVTGIPVEIRGRWEWSDPFILAVAYAA